MLKVHFHIGLRQCKLDEQLISRSQSAEQGLEALKHLRGSTRPPLCPSFPSEIRKARSFPPLPDFTRVSRRPPGPARPSTGMAAGPARTAFRMTASRGGASRDAISMTDERPRASQSMRNGRFRGLKRNGKIKTLLRRLRTIC